MVRSHEPGGKIQDLGVLETYRSMPTAATVSYPLLARR